MPVITLLDIHHARLGEREKSCGGKGKGKERPRVSYVYKKGKEGGEKEKERGRREGGLLFSP